MHFFVNKTWIRSIYFGSVLAALFGLSTAVAQDTQTEAVIDIAPEIQTATEQYQACINQQLSSMASAAEKRSSLQVECTVQRTALIELYPNDLKAWVEGLIDARLDAVLTSLEQVQNLVANTVQDVQVSVDELTVLEAEAATQAGE